MITTIVSTVAGVVGVVLAVWGRVSKLERRMMERVEVMERRMEVYSHGCR